MPRKTISIEALRKRVTAVVNHRIPPINMKHPDLESATSPDDLIARAYRIGMQDLLEHALHATGNYHGFRYTVEPYQADPTRRDYF